MTLQYANLKPEALYIEEQPDLEFLDIAMAKIQDGQVEQGMHLLVSELTTLYITTSSTSWDHLLEKGLLTHPIQDLLLQDPLTYRSFTRPRGYAGDAVLIDMIYFPQQTNMDSVSSIGQQIYRYNTRSPLSRTLRKRMKLTADYIDKFAQSRSNVSVLSVASGHCRELKYSEAMKNGDISKFVALDHDSASLNFMRNEYKDLNLESAPLSVSDLIKGKSQLGEFDLIYSAGLYDYLSTRFAQKLTKQLYNMLKPGGKLMLINIAQDYSEVGYLESYMNWAMVGRGKRETLELAAELRTNEPAILNVNNGAEISSHYNLLEIIRN
jgi:extracellular factor (EF) 3-hydroxypalmitic acid methyl ester biosynthesis protein